MRLLSRSAGACGGRCVTSVKRSLIEDHVIEQFRRHSDDDVHILFSHHADRLFRDFLE